MEQDLKFKVTSIWENLFLVLFALFAVIAYVVTYKMQLIGTPGSVIRILAWVFSLSFLVLRLAFKTTYIFDAQRKVLVCNYSLLNFNFSDVAARFGQISATGVDYSVFHLKGNGLAGALQQGSQRNYYKLLILLKSGKVIPLTNFELEAGQKHDYSAKKIAELVDCKYCPVDPGCQIYPIRLATGQYTFEKKMDDSAINKPMAWLIVIAFTLMLGALALEELAKGNSPSKPAKTEIKRKR